MHTIAVGETIRFGWENFKKRPWFFIGVVLVVIIISSILSSLTPQESSGLFSFLLTLAVVAINILIEMGLVAFALKAHDKLESASFNDLWHPQNFWYYLAVKILTGIVVIIGLILLIVPGIIAALALIFSTYLIIDRGMGPIEAMKESMRLTKGHRWQLFLLALALVGLNILGALALFVGLLVTIPVSLLAVAHAYRTLAGKSAAVSA